MRWLSLAVLCVIAAPADTRPYQVNDQLRLESYGQVQIAPGGQWAVIERRRAYNSAPNYRYDYLTRRLLSELLVVDLAHPGQARPLFAQASDAGYWSGGFSPSGTHLAIFRLQADTLRAGILDMATREVAWLPLAPDLPDANPSPIWVDDNHLLLATLDDQGLPALLETPTRAQHRLIAAWTRAEAGKGTSANLLASGRDRDTGLMIRNRTIHLVDTQTGAAQALFTGDIADLALSADQHRLAIVTRGSLALPSPTEPVDQAFEPRRHRLTVLDLDTGRRSTPCGACDVLPNYLAWSPEGQQLLFQGRKDGERWSQADLFRWSGVTDKNVPLFPPGLQAYSAIQGGNARSIAATWLGSSPIALALRAQRPDWYALSHRATTSLSSGLATPGARLGAITDRAVLLQSGDGWTWVDVRGRVQARINGEIIDPVQLDPFSPGTRRTIHPRPTLPILLRDKHGAHRLLNQAGGKPGPALPIEKGDQLLALVAPDIAITYTETRHGDGGLMLVGHKGRQILDRINLHLREVTPPRQIEFTTGNGSGKLVHRLTLPAPTKGKPPQLVVVPYPGMRMAGRPSTSTADPNPMTHAYLLAGHGFAVLEPSIPLPKGPAEPLAGLGAPVIAAIEEAQRQGWVAQTPPLLLGHSFGGYAVAGLLAQSDRFAAGIAVSGLYDLSAGYGGFDPRGNPQMAGISLTMPVGWYESGNGRMGAAPWQDPERYRRNSPFFSIERIRAPLMLIHGELDYAPVYQAERMFTALHRLGRDVQLVRYAGESHVLTSPDNIRDYWRRIFAFLDAHSNAGTSDQSSPQ